MLAGEHARHNLRGHSSAFNKSVMKLKNYLGPAHQPELVAGGALYGSRVVLDSGDFGPQLPDLLGQPGDFLVGTHLFLTQAL